MNAIKPERFRPPLSVDHDGPVIPDIGMPFPRHRHAEQDAARELTREWALAQAVMPADLITAFLDDLRYTDLIGGYYIGAPLPALTAINDFSLWFFVWDDRHDKDIRAGRAESWSRLHNALHDALDRPQAAPRRADPLVHAFADAVRRLCNPMSNHWAARFARHFHATIDAYNQEYRNRTTHTVPSVSEYLTLRRHTFGMAVWIDCLELAAEYELPDRVRITPSYRNAALASQEFSAWYNDLHNLGILLSHHRKISYRRAAELLARRVTRRIADYQRAEHDVERLMDRIDADRRLRAGVRRCLVNMRNWISSVYWFHYESCRYRMDGWDDPANPPYYRDTDC